MIEINNSDSNVIQSIDKLQDSLIELDLDNSWFDSIFSTNVEDNISLAIPESWLQQLTFENLTEFSLIERSTISDFNLVNEVFSLDREEDFIDYHFESQLEEIDDYITLDAFSGNPSHSIFTFGADDRVLVGDNDWDQRIAFITAQFPDGSSGGFTGALISPFHILTVAHGIYDKGNGGFAYLDSIQVSLGQHGTERYYGTVNAAEYTYFTGYTDDSNWRFTNGEWRPQSFNHDMAIITLDYNIGYSTGWFGYQYNNDHSYYQGLNVNTAGYPSDLADSWYWSNYQVADVDLYHVYGPITEVYQETFRYELDSAGGQSGSPVWTYNPSTEERYIVGVHSNGGIFSNGAVRITEGKFNVIKNLIDEQSQSSQPLNQPELVDYDDWFGTDLSYFQNNTTGSLIDDLSNSILSVEAGDSITLYSVINNSGTAKYDSDLYAVEPTIDVSFYASTDQDISESDYELGEVSISSLNPFESSDVYLETIFPDIPEGYYYIGYTFDSEMSEFDTSNNQGLIDDSLIYAI